MYKERSKSRLPKNKKKKTKRSKIKVNKTIRTEKGVYKV